MPWRGSKKEAQGRGTPHFVERILQNGKEFAGQKWKKAAPIRPRPLKK